MHENEIQQGGEMPSLHTLDSAERWQREAIDSTSALTGGGGWASVACIQFAIVARAVNLGCGAGCGLSCHRCVMSSGHTGNSCTTNGCVLPRDNTAFFISSQERI